MSLLVCFAVTRSLTLSLTFFFDSNGLASSPTATFPWLGIAIFVAIVMWCRTRGMHTSFGLITRVSMCFAGISLALAPLCADASPFLMRQMCMAATTFKGFVMILFSVEICYETGADAREVYPVNYTLFVAIVFAVGVLFWQLQGILDSHTLWDVVATVASITTICAIPLMPSRASNATTFTLEKLPENEGYADHLRRTRETLADRYGLTARQAEVLDLLLAGMKGQQIAEELGLSLWTVKGYITEIYAKMGVHSYKELMLLAAGGDASE